MRLRRDRRRVVARGFLFEAGPLLVGLFGGGEPPREALGHRRGADAPQPRVAVEFVESEEDVLAGALGVALEGFDSNSDLRVGDSDDRVLERAPEAVAGRGGLGAGSK